MAVFILAGVLGWTYVGYPLWMRIWAWLGGRAVRTGRWEGRAAVLMSAHGEGGAVVEKLRNLEELRAAGEPLDEVWLGLDGEPAGAELSAWAAGREWVHVVEGGERRRGKAGMLNLLMRAAGEGADAWVMMDVRQRVEAGAVRKLLETFADGSVGVASGELVYERAEGGVEKGAESYWDYEKGLREAESRVWAAAGATGALYAIRRELCRELPEGTLDDDVLIPMRAVMAGRRCLFVRGARAWDRAEARLDREGRRKRRTLAGVWQAAGLEPGLLLPWRNPIWGRFVSHKILRLATPFVAAGALAAAWGAAWGAWGAGGWERWAWGGVAVAGTAGVLASAAAAWAARRTRSRLLGVLGAAWTVNAVLLLAAWDAVRGRYGGLWVRS